MEEAEIRSERQSRAERHFTTKQLNINPGRFDRGI